MKTAFFAIVLLMSLNFSFAMAEEHFGIQAYPGAISDATTDWYCKQFAPESERQAKVVAKVDQNTNAFCFHTKDSFDKVAAFFQKNKGLEILGKIERKGDNMSVVFCLPEMKCASMGDGVDVTVTTPWADDHKRYQDVLITMRKSTKK